MARFLGEVNDIPAMVTAGWADTALGRLPAALPDGPAQLLLRPEGLRVLPPGTPDAAPAEVEACRLLGATTMAHMALPDGQGQILHVHARLPPGILLRWGEAVSLRADPQRAFAFPLALADGCRAVPGGG